MYSEKIILRNLDGFAAKEGWQPVYHTYDEVRNFSAYLDTLVHKESNSKSSFISVIKPITAKRQKEIARWIENEQVLCSIDSGYWESRYAFVCDEKGQIYKFKNRKPQEIFDAIIAGFDEKQVSIELLILKARQVGITTKTAMKFIHRLMFVPHTQAVMASVQKEKSQLIGRILDTAYERSPWWLVPNRLPKRSFDNGSILSIQSGMQATGLAQGWTPTSIHVCLTPNTLVRVGNGLLKPIALIAAGDTVITKEGEIAQVKAMVKSSRTNEISREIWLWGNFAPLGSTLDHPVFTAEGWKRADGIVEGDWVRHPVRAITRKIERFRGTHLLRSRRVDRGERFWVNLNPAWGYICGLYLAEGSCRGTTRFKTENAKASGLVFSIHEKEIDAVRERLKAAFGETQHIGQYVRSGTASAKLTVDVAHLARWMSQNFGTTDNKHVPDWVWNAGREFCLQLVKGYLDGDGHYAPEKNEIYASSVRVQIPVQMRDLIASLGFGWSSIQYKSAGVYYERNCREQWTLILNGETGRRLREYFGLAWLPCEASLHSKYDLLNENIDIQVEAVADGFSESFYDIEVDHPSHSFLTVQCAVKNSELADIPDPRRVIEEGLFRAAHSSKNLFMVLEGTGGGNTGWLADTWRSCKEDWPKGLARLCPIFIPWAMCPDIYPEEDWVRKFPVPGGFRPHETTRKHIAKCESYVRNTPYLAQIAGRDWVMPVEQKWFWQFNYDQACKNHTQKTWAAQMPADDFEALTGVHDSVFDPEVLAEVEDRIYEVLPDNQRVRKTPMQAYAITGHDVDRAFYPSDERIDWTKDCIRVEWDSNRGQHYEWTMVPVLLPDESKERNTLDYLLIYEWPKQNNRYSCGIDTADGLGKEDEERTCLSVTKNRFAGQSDQQVAELTSNRINSAQVVAFAACVGALYGPSCPDERGIKFCIEQIQGPGDTCQHQLKMMGFMNQHIPRRYDSKKIKDDGTKKEGWYSTSWSVPILMTRFVEAVNGGWYEPRSMWLLEELRTLERHETAGKSKMEHQSDRFDDRVRAAAQSYFTAHDFDVLTERAQKRYAQPVNKLVVSKERCTVNQINVGW